MEDVDLESRDMGYILPEENSVAAAINQLPVDYRQVFQLHFDQGYSTREVADILSFSHVKVLKCIERGRGKLKKILEEEVNDDEIDG